MTTSAADYLEVYLEPLLPQLVRDDVSDIYVNRAGEAWIELQGGEMERLDLPALTPSHLARLARQVAAVSHQGINRESPLLAATLPDGARVQIVGPPATREGMAIAIRKHLAIDIALSDYVLAGAFAETSRDTPPDPATAALEAHHAAGDWPGFLALAVKAGRTIVVSGGTSSGKTTFLNALLREVASDQRLILIEDTPELVLRHANAVGLVAVRGEMGEARVTTNDLLLAALRMRPDRIIVGELRGAEAFTFLRAANTGHPGSMTTIHADSPDRAFDQLAMMVAQAHPALSHAAIVEHARRTVEIVVQLERSEGRRRIAQVLWNRISG